VSRRNAEMKGKVMVYGKEIQKRNNKALSDRHLRIGMHIFGC
jgi:ABC-type methionine transport system ATPase subunit